MYILGQAVKEAILESNGKLKREDFFIVSKLWNTFHSKNSVSKALSESLTSFDLEYIDLYLIHWPMGFAVKLITNRKYKFFFFNSFLIIKENTGEKFPKDKDGNRLYSEVHYLETYKVYFISVI